MRAAYAGRRWSSSRVAPPPGAGAPRHIDFAVLERFKTTTVILGCYDISKSRVATVDEMEARPKSAVEHIDRERLIAAPDCELGLLPRDIAVAKMTNLCVAAARICTAVTSTTWVRSSPTTRHSSKSITLMG